MTAAPSGSVAALLRSRVRDVPDYPKPGILFKDITPLLADPAAYVAMVDAFVAPYTGQRSDTGPPGGTGSAVDRVRGVDGVGVDGVGVDGVGIDKVVGIEARGFVLAAPVAYRLAAGFVPVRKAGKLPGRTLRSSYQLEYGEATLELTSDGVRPGDRVLVIDDVLATGGTAAATVGLLRRAGAEVLGVSVLLELTGLGGRDRLGDLRVDALLRC